MAVSDISITGPISPYINSTDPSIYPTHYSDYTHGGRHEVSSYPSYTVLDDALLKLGMYVYVTTTHNITDAAGNNIKDENDNPITSEPTGYILTAFTLSTSTSEYDGTRTWMAEKDYISGLDLTLDFGSLV